MKSHADPLCDLDHFLFLCTLAKSDIYRHLNSFYYRRPSYISSYFSADTCSFFRTVDSCLNNAVHICIRCYRFRNRCCHRTSAGNRQIIIMRYHGYYRCIIDRLIYITRIKQTDWCNLHGRTVGCLSRKQLDRIRFRYLFSLITADCHTSCRSRKTVKKYRVFRPVNQCLFYHFGRNLTIVVDNMSGNKIRRTKIICCLPRLVAFGKCIHWRHFKICHLVSEILKDLFGRPALSCCSHGIAGSCSDQTSQDSVI